LRDTEIIESIRTCLDVPVGRHLYGVLGSYQRLKTFAEELQQATTPDGQPFPVPVSVNKGILDSIPDDEFHHLVENEAKRPEPTVAHVAQAFEHFLRSHLKGGGVLVLANFEMLFAYNIELSLLRTLARDEDRLLLLLPGRRGRGRVVMFPDVDKGSYTLPTNLIAENHLWELRD
jgi:hypothetical protein